jgi:biotin operon repressor
MCGGPSTAKAATTRRQQPVVSNPRTQADYVLNSLTDGVYAHGRSAGNLAWAIGAPEPSIRRAIGTLRRRGVNIVRQDGFYRLA